LEGVFGLVVAVPEGAGVAAGVLLAIFGPFVALLSGIIDVRMRMRKGLPAEPLPPDAIGKSADGLYVYREDAFETLGRDRSRR
jgi:hypothetical protein